MSSLRENDSPADTGNAFLLSRSPVRRKLQGHGMEKLNLRRDVYPRLLCDFNRGTVLPVGANVGLSGIAHRPELKATGRARSLSRSLRVCFER